MSISFFEPPFGGKKAHLLLSLCFALHPVHRASWLDDVHTAGTVCWSQGRRGMSLRGRKETPDALGAADMFIPSGCRSSLCQCNNSSSPNITRHNCTQPPSWLTRQPSQPSPGWLPQPEQASRPAFLSWLTHQTQPWCSSNARSFMGGGHMCFQHTKPVTQRVPRDDARGAVSDAAATKRGAREPE